MADVFVVGSINQDFVLRLERRPEPGETVTDAELGLYAGGKGANQAAAAALLGSRTALLGRVAEDGFGADLLAGLTGRGVDTSLVQALRGTPTGSAFITVTPDGQNAIIVSPGANRRLTPGDVDGAASAIGEARVLVAQMELPTETVYRATSIAESSGVRVLLNLAPPREVPKDVLETLDPLVVNESEASFLLGSRIDGPDEAAKAASSLLGFGCRSAVLTLGAAGAVVADGNMTELLPAPVVSAVDTTAAGDAFVGALAMRLASGKTLVEAAEYAVRAGAAAVTRSGAQDSLPGPEDVESI